jgi:hypothetical protein
MVMTTKMAVNDDGPDDANGIIWAIGKCPDVASQLSGSMYVSFYVSLFVLLMNI